LKKVSKEKKISKDKNKSGEKKQNRKLYSRQNIQGEYKRDLIKLIH